MTGEAKPLGLENAAGDREEDGTTGYRWYLSGAFLGTLAILGIIGMFYVALSLFVLGPTAALMQQKDAVLPASPVSWFPGWFGVFNAWLLIVVTAIPYAVTFSYVLTMRAEKTNRLHLQLKNLEPDDRRAVETILDSMFRFSRYVGAAAAPTVVTFLGATAILFFKPVMTAEIAGIDLSQGANVLLLGIGIADVAAPDKTGPILFWSITAFSFGFLGAWLYFVTDLTRSFFNCDLRPRTLIAGAIRMSVASVVALVAALALQSVMGLELAASVSEMAAAATDGLVGGTKTPGTAGNWLVALAFTIGFFPQTGFGYIKSVGSMVLRILPGNAYNTTALTELPGMSYGHSERLQLEGIDAVENLAGQHPILMTLQTGFTYAIVEAWIGEAWLRGYLGETRHAALAEKTGLRGKYELRRLAWRLAATQDGPPSQDDAAQALETFLIEAMDPQKADIQRWQVLARLCLYFDSWGGSTGQ